MDRLEELLRRVHEPRECAELLLGAPAGVANAVARQLSAVLSSPPPGVAQADRFERVAALVLLALLCTTLAALA